MCKYLLNLWGTEPPAADLAAGFLLVPRGRKFKLDSARLSHFQEVTIMTKVYFYFPLHSKFFFHFNRYTRDPNSSPHADLESNAIVSGPSLRLLTNRRLLICPTIFVDNFLVLLVVVSVCLLLVRKCPSVLKRMVYFGENREGINYIGYTV